MSIQRIDSLLAQGPFASVPFGSRTGGRSAGSEFRALLSNTLDRGPDGALNPPAPLSKTELTQIAEAFRIRMNSRLLQALSPEAGDDLDLLLASVLDRLTPVSAEPPAIFPPSAALQTPSRTKTNFDPIIEEAASAFGVDPGLIKSVIAVESRFDPSSTSPKGAMGLMQLMPATARELGVGDAYDPVQNVRAGTRYLKMLLDRYNGDIPMALAAYNWGMGNLEKRPEQMPLETRNYIGRVSRHYERMSVS